MFYQIICRTIDESPRWYPLYLGSQQFWMPSHIILCQLPFLTIDLQNLNAPMLKTGLVQFILVDISGILCFFEFFYHFFIFVNGLQALYVNPNCLKGISGMNLSSSNKNLFLMLFIFIHFKQISPNNGILLKEVLIPNWLKNPLTSCSLINFYFLLLHAERFDKSIIFSLLVFETLGCLLSVFFLQFKQHDNIVL